MFRRFGSAVTLVQRDRRLLTREDPDVAEALTAILSDEGIDIRLGARASATRPGPDGVELVIDTDDGPATLSGSHLLVATGRVPNTAGLRLAAAGVESDDRGFVRVDDRLETNVPGIYGFGDVTPGPAFTHAALDDFRILSTNLLGGMRATTAGRIIPYVLFSDPQLGRVGLTETEARAHGRSIRVAKLPMSHAGPTRAQEPGETRGLLKVILDADSDQILGAAILSVEGGELMAVLQVAMIGQLPYTAIRDAIFARHADAGGGTREPPRDRRLEELFRSRGAAEVVPGGDCRGGPGGDCRSPAQSTRPFAPLFGALTWPRSAAVEEPPRGLVSWVGELDAQLVQGQLAGCVEAHDHADGPDDLAIDAKMGTDDHGPRVAVVSAHEVGPDELGAEQAHAAMVGRGDVPVAVNDERGVRLVRVEHTLHGGLVGREIGRSGHHRARGRHVDLPAAASATAAGSAVRPAGPEQTLVTMRLAMALRRAAWPLKLYLRHRLGRETTAILETWEQHAPAQVRANLGHAAPAA
jgi:hypothetical protein